MPQELAITTHIKAYLERKRVIVGFRVKVKGLVNLKQNSLQ